MLMAKKVTKHDMIAALEQHMDDEALIELIDRADSTDNPCAVLQEELEKLSQPLPMQLDNDGIEIVPVIRRMVDVRTGDHRDIIDGYHLKRTVNGTELYSGTALDWGPPCNRTLFKTVVDAQKGVDVLLDLERHRVKVLKTRRRSITFHVPIELPKKEMNGVTFSVRLTTEETLKMESLLTGLRITNEELAPNSPVDSYPDVLRWFLKQF